MTSELLSVVESSRIAASRSIAVKKKKLAEQYFTPQRVALLMAEMFSVQFGRLISCLDPCAGVGNLSAAVIALGHTRHERMKITAIEKDAYLFNAAKENLRSCADVDVIKGDFLQRYLRLGKFERIVLNPPYAKLSPESALGKKVREHLGYRENNLYSAFIACCLKLLTDDGELVAIIPRSFCNGAMFSELENFCWRIFGFMRCIYSNLAEYFMIPVWFRNQSLLRWVRDKPHEYWFRTRERTVRSRKFYIRFPRSC
ncbi:N-6 DNA methylase [Achromobacter sp. ACRQX]|uniref:N-6 DNA methylase n=1 Tax=Achromobacter sp. ACRQX TaxID=2918181 RepID=UPI001EF37C21|nr:N-6 DNA methylase [Achromobacter sp. ACRQX]